MKGLKWRFASLSKSTVKSLKQRFYVLVKTAVKGVNGDLPVSQKA
jgi:hypothetical protein